MRSSNCARTSSKLIQTLKVSKNSSKNNFPFSSVGAVFNREGRGYKPLLRL